MSVPGLTLVVPPERLWRIGRRDDPLRFARISQTDATLPRAGNRFDVPGGGVLYAATTIQGCFAETLARFRPSPAVAAAVREDPGYMDPGGIPAAWREDRRLVSFALAAPLPFVDIDNTSTLLALGPQLHGELAALGVDELDRGSVYSANRRLTRVLASWLYSRTDDDGQPRYGGIRYESRLGRQWECWAIFDGALLTTSTVTPIDSRNSALMAIADQYGLTPH